MDLSLTAPMPTAAGDALTPIQARNLAVLRRTEPALVFDRELVAELHTDITTALDVMGSRLGAQQLVVTKHGLGTVLGCEAHHLAPDDFAWSPARAKGTVVHKAIQLLLNWNGEPAPRLVVDEALARLSDEETSVGDYVAGLRPGEDADLRGQSVDLLTKFMADFPPLDLRSHPMTETSIRFPLDGPIVLRAKVDLVIGKPQGAEARKVIIDLKSGRIVDRHRQDLRFYALVETLCRGVPPRLLASYSLDASTAVTEPVTPALLRSTLRRTLDAIARMVELRVEDRPPERTPSVTCRWCQLRPTCPPGLASLAAAGDLDGDGMA